MTSGLTTLARGNLPSNCRFMASAASPAAKILSYKSTSVEITKKDNGIVVAAVDTLSPMTSLGVIVKSGARNEAYHQLGLNHLMKLCSGLGTNNFTSLSITRNLQQLGSFLHCSVNREHTFYATHFLEKNVNYGIDFFLQSISGQRFNRWEVLDMEKRMQYEIDGLSISDKATDLLHKAAYRDGLGNSLYAPQHKVGKFNCLDLMDYYKQHFTSKNTALIGIGIPLEKLQHYADLLEFESKAGPTPTQSKVHKNGELRQEIGGKRVAISIGFEAPGSNDKKGFVASLLLSHILGKGSHSKYGFGTGRMHKSLKNESDKVKTKVESFYHYYSDSSLLGFNIECDAENANTIVNSIMSAIRTGSTISEEELKSAKKDALLELLCMNQNPELALEDMGRQLINFGDITPSENIPSIINGAALADVQTVAKQVATTPNVAMAAVGNLSHTPYLDSLL